MKTKTRKTYEYFINGFKIPNLKLCAELLGVTHSCLHADITIKNKDQDYFRIFNKNILEAKIVNLDINYYKHCLK